MYFLPVTRWATGPLGLSLRIRTCLGDLARVFSSCLWSAYRFVCILPWVDSSYWPTFECTLIWFTVFDLSCLEAPAGVRWGSQVGAVLCTRTYVWRLRDELWQSCDASRASTEQCQCGAGRMLYAWLPLCSYVQYIGRRWIGEFMIMTCGF